MPGVPGALGPRNARVQRLRRLSSDRRARDAEGAFVIEGPVLVGDAAAAGIVLDEVFVEAGSGFTPPPGPVVHEVAVGVLSRVADAVTSRGVAAVARRPDHTHADAPPGTPVLVLVAIADPGNAGTLVRAGEAAGFGAVLFTAGSVDPWSPKCVRASAGSVFRCPVVSGGEGATVLDEVRATGRRRVGTRAQQAPPYDAAELPHDAALVLGNEAHGLPAELDGSIDEWVSIPMAPAVESLNVAMAGTILCFEVARRARARAT